MTKTVWKYRLDASDTCVLELPKGAKPLSFGFQGSGPQLWALVDPHETEKVSRTFRLLGTGHDSGKSDLRFIGTAFIGEYVFHLFEVENA